MIVGVVGSDGIVLAADQRAIAPAPGEGLMDDTYGIRKIVDLPEHRTAYACAGDFVTAEVGKALARQLRTQVGFVMTADSLEDLAKQTCAEAERDYPGQIGEAHRMMLVVAYNGDARLWRIDVRGRGSSALNVRTIAVAGALGNAARFFAGYHQSGRTTDELTFLAAHTVLTGGRIDPNYVHGLDVAIFAPGKCSFLAQSKRAELQERSIALDEMLRAQIYASNSARPQT